MRKPVFKQERQCFRIVLRSGIVAYASWLCWQTVNDKLCYL